ncbi:MAG TPA: hypothetical protein VF275_10895 [Gammaproteobacteria bacterium]
MRNVFAAVVLVTGFVSQAAADDLDNLDALSQAQFQLLAEDLSGVLSYKGLQPAEPYGVVGFGVGLETSVVRVESEGVWQQAGVDDVSSIPVARLAVTKGLPLGFDVGGFIATAPGTGFKNYGAQLRYALVEGGVAMPAVGLRAAVTRLAGVDQLAFDTRSLDVSISKGFGPVTPYAGYGRVWATATPGESTGLSEVDVDGNRAFAGVRFSFVVLQFVLEADRVGDTTAYSAKLGFGF